MALRRARATGSLDARFNSERGIGRREKLNLKLDCVEVFNDGPNFSLREYRLEFSGKLKGNSLNPHTRAIHARDNDAIIRR